MSNGVKCVNFYRDKYFYVYNELDNLILDALACCNNIDANYHLNLYHNIKDGKIDETYYSYILKDDYDTYPKKYCDILKNLYSIWVCLRKSIEQFAWLENIEFNELMYNLENNIHSQATFEIPGNYDKDVILDSFLDIESSLDTIFEYCDFNRKEVLTEDLQCLIYIASKFEGEYVTTEKFIFPSPEDLDDIAETYGRLIEDISEMKEMLDDAKDSMKTKNCECDEGLIAFLQDCLSEMSNEYIDTYDIIVNKPGEYKESIVMDYNSLMAYKNYILRLLDPFIRESEKTEAHGLLDRAQVERKDDVVNGIKELFPYSDEFAITLFHLAYNMITVTDFTKKAIKEREKYLLEEK